MRWSAAGGDNNRNWYYVLIAFLCDGCSLEVVEFVVKELANIPW
uniref:MIP16134p n=1 Tax=Drosophila melanogaster TaxID=7227 RepID=D3DMN1_DROME|nr:MIP16134p [Drosophila melanogaster]